MLRTVAAIGLAILQGPSAFAAERDSVPQTLTIPVYFLNAAGKPMPAAENPKDLKIELGAIAGSLGGNPDAQLQTIRVGPGSRFQLDIEGLSSKLVAHAKRFSERSGAPIQLTPADARFARVSSFASTSAGPLVGFAAVFWDSRGNGSLVPLYCDRPCRLRAPDSAETFEVDSPAPGLLWMLTTRDQNSRFVHSRAQSPRPVLVIAPPEALERVSPSIFGKPAP